VLGGPSKSPFVSHSASDMDWQVSTESLITLSPSSLHFFRGLSTVRSTNESLCLFAGAAGSGSGIGSGIGSGSGSQSGSEDGEDGEDGESYQGLLGDSGSQPGGESCRLPVGDSGCHPGGDSSPIRG